MRVLCVKYGIKYGAEWVINLRNMVARHLPVRHDFLCMTEIPVDGIGCIPFTRELPTWWSKLNIFEPGRFPGENLYLDLDVVITGNLEPLVRCLDKSTKLWALNDFSYSLTHPRQGLDAAFIKYMGGRPGTVNSSVMLWEGDIARKAWDDFTPSIMDEVHGDQNWLTRCLWPDINLIPEGIAQSYKYHVRRGQDGAPITVFHGNPKVTDLPRTDRLRQAWK